MTSDCAAIFSSYSDARTARACCRSSQLELNPKRSSPWPPAGLARFGAGGGAECVFDAARRSASGNRGSKTVCRPPRPSAPLRMNAPPSDWADAAASPRRKEAGEAARSPVPMPPRDENTRGGTGAGGGGAGGGALTGGSERAACGCCSVDAPARSLSARITDSAAAARASAAAARASAAPADATARASSSRTLAVSALPRATARLSARMTSSEGVPAPPGVCRSAETAAAYTASASAHAVPGQPSAPGAQPPSERSRESILAAVAARISAACASARARLAASRSAASEARSASRSRTSAAFARAASAAVAAAAAASASACARKAEADAWSPGSGSPAQASRSVAVSQRSQRAACTRTA